MIYYLPELLFDIIPEYSFKNELELINLEGIIFDLENKIHKKKEKDNIFISLFFLRKAYVYFKKNNINKFLFTSKIATFYKNKNEEPYIYTFIGPHKDSFLVVRSIDNLSDSEIIFLNIIRKKDIFILIDDNIMEKYFMTGSLNI